MATATGIRAQQTEMRHFAFCDFGSSSRITVPGCADVSNIAEEAQANKGSMGERTADPAGELTIGEFLGE